MGWSVGGGVGRIGFKRSTETTYWRLGQKCYSLLVAVVLLTYNSICLNGGVKDGAIFAGLISHRFGQHS